VWFDHHSAGAEIRTANWQFIPFVSRGVACEADAETVVEPPTATAIWRTVEINAFVVVLVVRGELHPVHDPKTVVAHTHSIAGVSAVPVHVDAIAIIRLVADRECPVLGRVPVSARPLLHFHPQSIGARTAQKVHFLKAEPEVGVDRSKPGFVVGPRQLPVEGAADMLVNDDPAEDRHECRVAGQGRHGYVDGEVLCNEICETVVYTSRTVHTMN